MSGSHQLGAMYHHTIESSFCQVGRKTTTAYFCHSVSRLLWTNGGTGAPLYKNLRRPVSESYIVFAIRDANPGTAAVMVGPCP